MKKLAILVLFILIILFGLHTYMKLKTANDGYLNKNNIATENISISQSQQPVFNNKKTKYIYSDQHISFEYPLTLKADYSQQPDPYVVKVDFIGECKRHRVISFSYKATESDKPEDYILGQKNPYGPSEQTSNIIKMKDITAGKNVQPAGDGSGGYEPKIVVDFLSKSKKFHFYFMVVSGCSNSLEETYQTELLPILNSVELSD